MPIPQAYLRITVTLAASLTLAAVAAHAFLVPETAANIHGYGACVIGAAVAFFCAATDSRYATAAAVVLGAPALRAAAFAAAAMSNGAGHAAPLQALASPTLFTDVCLCFAASVALAAPLLAAADPAARRILGRVAVVATAVVTLLLCPGSVVFDRVVPAAVEICGAVAAASVRRQLVLLATPLIVTSVMSAAVLLLAPVSAAVVRCCAAAIVAVVMCLAVSVTSDWQSFAGICPAVVVFGGSAPVLVAQLLRLATVAVVLPLMIASVAALWEAEVAEDSESNDDSSSIPKRAVVVKQDPLAVV